MAEQNHVGQIVLSETVEDRLDHFVKADSLVSLGRLPAIVAYTWYVPTGMDQNVAGYDQVSPGEQLSYRIGGTD